MAASSIFAPCLESEARPDWSGNYEFIDPEDETRHPHRIEPVTLRRYLEAYTNHFALWKNAARRHQAALARIPAGEGTHRRPLPRSRPRPRPRNLLRFKDQEPRTPVNQTAFTG